MQVWISNVEIFFSILKNFQFGTLYFNFFFKFSLLNLYINLSFI